MKICISAGHAMKVQGAIGPEPWGLNEVDEARRVMNTVADYLKKLGHSAETYADDISTSQNENLHRIVDWHNSQTRDGDCSIHFNAYMPKDSGMGTEVLYYSQQDVARRVADAISNSSGLINRHEKFRDDLFFLNNTDEPAILIEVCFVDSKTDCDLYRKNFDAICRAIAMVANKGRPDLYEWHGTMSHFGGPQDTGVDPDEMLAFIYSIEDQPVLFLDEQPPGTTGLARRLDPAEPYIALRWNYDQTPRDLLLTKLAKVTSKKTGKSAMAIPADWGPHIDTGRVADLSPGLCELLDLITDDEISVTFPHDPRSSK